MKRILCAFLIVILLAGTSLSIFADKIKAAAGTNDAGMTSETAFSDRDESVHTSSTRKIKLRSLSLIVPSNMLAKGQKMKLRAKYIPSNTSDRTITWSTSNKRIATVNRSGVVTGKREGTVTITAKCQEKTVKAKIHINPEGIITIIDDDGRKEFMKKMLPLAEEKEIPISSAAIIGSLGDKKHMSWDDLKTLESSGCEVLCHTYSHFLYDKASS